MNTINHCKVYEYGFIYALAHYYQQEKRFNFSPVRPSFKRNHSAALQLPLPASQTKPICMNFRIIDYRPLIIVSLLINSRRTSTNVVADRNTLRVPHLPDWTRRNLTQSEPYYGAMCADFPYTANCKLSLLRSLLA